MRSILLFLVASLCSGPLFAAQSSHVRSQLMQTILSGDDPFDYSSQRTLRFHGGPYISRFSRVFAVDSNFGELLPFGESKKAVVYSDFAPSWSDLGMEVASRKGNSSLMVYISYVL